MEKCKECGGKGKHLMKCLSCNMFFHPKCCHYVRFYWRGGFCLDPKCQEVKETTQPFPEKPVKPKVDYKSASESSVDLEEFEAVTCHRCGEPKSHSSVKTCHNPDCNKSFCNSCIIRRYKMHYRDIPKDWRCFVCQKICSCSECRNSFSEKKRNDQRTNRRQIDESCHVCKKKSRLYQMQKCLCCDRSYCAQCIQKEDVNLNRCDVCLEKCKCHQCAETAFKEDIEKLVRGPDLREIYPYDVENIYQVNGFWVRDILM